MFTVPNLFGAWQRSEDSHRLLLFVHFIPIDNKYPTWIFPLLHCLLLMGPSTHGIWCIWWAHFNIVTSWGVTISLIWTGICENISVYVHTVIILTLWIFSGMRLFQPFIAALLSIRCKTSMIYQWMNRCNYLANRVDHGCALILLHP